MSKTSIWDIKTELVTFLRNQDIISVASRGVTTSQDTGTFSSDSTHTLGTNPTLVKNVRDITRGSLLVFGTDYTVDYATGIISFTSAQTGSYTINYDQGSADKIWPDFPQPYLKLNQFPRIAVDVINGSTTEIALGAGTTRSTYDVTIVCYDKSQSNVEGLIASVRSKVLDNKKNLFYSSFITLTSMGPLMISPFGEKKVFQRNQDCKVQFIYET